MTSEHSAAENSGTESTSQQDMGLMLQRRALYELERANAKPYRSPKRIALVSLAVAVTMCLFLLFLDKSVKVAHHVIDIWAPVIFDTKKAGPMPLDISPPPQSANTASTSSEAAYMIKVVPASQQSSTSSQRAK
jgi:hypothetical protein